MKRIISIITLTAVLLSLMLTGPVSAAENSNTDLKKAIEIAKTAFNFDTTNLDFNSSYSETNYGRKLWYLNWNSASGSGSSISVTVDAATGEVINMNQWENTYTPAKKIPTYTKEEALKVAENLLKKLHPDKYKDTELMDEYQSNYRIYYSSDSYSFYFMRKINGIDFQDNGMQIQVDKNTLKVRSFNLEWDTITPIPDSKNAIKAEEAKKIYAEKLGLEMAYQMIYPSNGGDPKLVLVYTQKNSNNPLDALTGEIITQPYYGPMYGAQEKYAMGGDAAINSAATPQEQKVIDDSSKYISKEKALEALSKYLDIDSKYKMDHSSLYGGYNKENAAWSFSWSYNDNKTYNYLYGSVDAVTGEVKNFTISNNEDQNKIGTTPKYTKEQCREIAEKFLNEIQPDKFKKSEYREQYYEIYTQPQNIVNYNMYYIIKENGVSAPFNNLNVTVNAHTGKVTGFNMAWQNLEFPSTEGSISLEDAYKALYAKHDLKLKYIRVYNYNLNNGSNEIRLAYIPDNFYGLIDAKSGKFIDYNGNPIAESNKTDFTDIAGHKFEKDIKLLAELGVLDSTEGKFNPDAKVLQKDFVKYLMKATQPEYYPIPYAAKDSSEYDRYYDNAIMQNILAKKDKNPDGLVTRMDASKMIVKALGVGFVADLGNIFNLDAKDAASITAENKGYAAIALALGITDSTDGSFQPAMELTRGESAGMMINFLKVDKTPASSLPIDAVPLTMPAAE